MRRNLSALAALILLCLVPSLAPAVEIINLRPTYGTLGATRKLGKTPKILPGDQLYFDYAIDGLKVEEKTNRVRYETVFEFFDSSDKRLKRIETPNQAVLYFGGKRMPGEMGVVIGDAYKPGRYTIKLTVKDMLAGKEASIVYPIQVVQPAFGFVHVEAPALALPGTATGVRMLVIGFTPDNKKQPNVDVTIRILDANDKLMSPPVVTSYPDAIPVGTPQPVTFLPVYFPIPTVNRPGQFYIEVVAVDKNAGKKEIKLRLPLTVLDIGAVTGR